MLEPLTRSAHRTDRVRRERRSRCHYPDGPFPPRGCRERRPRPRYGRFRVRPWPSPRRTVPVSGLAVSAAPAPATPHHRYRRCVGRGPGCSEDLTPGLAPCMRPAPRRSSPGTTAPDPTSRRPSTGDLRLVERVGSSSFECRDQVSGHRVRRRASGRQVTVGVADSCRRAPEGRCELLARAHPCHCAGE